MSDDPGIVHGKSYRCKWCRDTKIMPVITLGTAKDAVGNIRLTMTFDTSWCTSHQDETISSSKKFEDEWPELPGWLAADAEPYLVPPFNIPREFTNIGTTS
jgi:hypothetical protein